MDRLLVVKLEAVGCRAEALLNGIPLAQARDGQAPVLVPAHEYTVAGTNRLELRVTPPEPGTPVRPGERAHAQVRVLLPRIGHPIHEDSSRTLGQLDWVDQAHTAPVQASSLSLPVSFPRWRWLDAPVVEPTPSVHTLVSAFLQAVVKDLAAGNADRLVQASRLRTEELAIAYQRDPRAQAQRWRSHLQALHAAGPLAFEPPGGAGLVLRPLAGGRLLDCLGPHAQPALRTTPDAQGQSHAFALRVAVLEGQVHVLR